MEEADSLDSRSASELIDERIAEVGGRRGETLSRMRELIKEADPDVVEELKWVKATNLALPPGHTTGSSAPVSHTGRS